jgi:hypothetical protein
LRIKPYILKLLSKDMLSILVYIVNTVVNKGRKMEEKSMRLGGHQWMWGRRNHRRCNVGKAVENDVEIDDNRYKTFEK